MPNVSYTIWSRRTSDLEMFKEFLENVVFRYMRELLKAFSEDFFGGLTLGVNFGPTWGQISTSEVDI